MSMSDPLVDTWLINARLDVYLLRSLPEAALSAVAPSGGRTIAETFAHLHNVRLMWLKASSPDLLAGLEKIEKVPAPTGASLEKALDASAAAVATLVSRAQEAGGKVKGFKPHVHAFVGYLVSHESHHRGQVALTLKLAGHAMDKKITYGLWEWGSR
jgi:uncharacterized damage-inducible protein DinB